MVGRVVHACLAALVGGPAGPPTLDDPAVRATIRQALARETRPAAIAAEVEILVHIFLRDHLAAPPWRYVDTELRLGPCVADHVVSDGSRWRIDEVKTASVHHYGARIEVADQLERLYHAGVRRWGSAFVGVRLIALADVTVVRTFSSLEEIASFVNDAPRSSTGRHRHHLQRPDPDRARPVFALSVEQAARLASLGSVRIAYVMAVADGLHASYEQFRRASEDARRATPRAGTAMERPS